MSTLTDDPRPGTRQWVTMGLSDLAARATDTSLWLRTEGDFDRYPTIMTHLAQFADQVREEAQATGVYSESAGNLVTIAADLIGLMAADPEDIRTARDRHASALDRAATILLGARVLTQNAGAR